MPEPTPAAKRLRYAVAALGLLMELTAIVLMVAADVSFVLALPLLIIGMFLALVPVFGTRSKATR